MQDLRWVYISPHFDDVVLSCGGLVWEQSRAGYQVETWTICAGNPPRGRISFYAKSLHDRWDLDEHAVRIRRLEDRASNAILSSIPRYFNLPDCIYRRSKENLLPLYTNEEEIFGSLHEEDKDCIPTISTWLLRRGGAHAEVVCPLGLGGHVDHILAQRAVEAAGLTPWYYADFPYLVKHQGELETLEKRGWMNKIFPISEEGLRAWIDAINAHTSQISTFWPDKETMHSSLRYYYDQHNGLRLWKPSSEIL